MQTRFKTPSFSAILFFALGLLLFIPLLASFMPLFEGGIINNIYRALRQKRFINSFKYGLLQAGFSSILSFVIALPSAFLLAKRKFFGKKLLSILSAIPFSMPPLVIAIGFVLYYGKEGIINKTLMNIFKLNAPPLNFLYSFTGLVLTHGLYNFPLVMRFISDAWRSCPVSHEEQATLLGASKIKIFFTITLPSLMPAIGSALSIVFLLCFFSFVIVLLFGGIGVTTPEVELYRAMRFEFDAPLASAFALVETIIALLILSVYAKFEKHAKVDYRDTSRAIISGKQAQKIKTVLGKFITYSYLLIIFFIFIAPLFSIVLNAMYSQKNHGIDGGYFGLSNFVFIFKRKSFMPALLNTIIIASLSASISSVFGFLMSSNIRKNKHIFFSKVLPLLPLAISSVVLSFGWTTILGRSSFITIAAIQAMSAWPFVFRAITSAKGVSDSNYSDAAFTLGSNKFSTLLKIELPMNATFIASGFALAFAMSIGDSNAIIAAPVSGFETLALLLYRLSGTYKFNESCAMAVILSVISFSVFAIKDKIYGHN